MDGQAPGILCGGDGSWYGYLAKDLMAYLTDREIFPHLEYRIIEQNPSIRAHQEKLLEDFRHKVKWTSDLKGTGPVSGCFLSNELLDAFPVKLVEMDHELMEIYVSVSSQDFLLKKGKRLFRRTPHLLKRKKPCSAEIRDYFKGFSLELPKGTGLR